MRSIALGLLLGMALALPAELVPTAESASPARLASVKLVKCRQSASQEKRFMKVRGKMRAIGAGDGMQIRFTILERTGKRWEDVTPPELKVWNQARPNARAFIYRQRIDNLKAPARYRVTAKFRWLDGSSVIRVAKRRTRICRTREHKPDLVAASIGLVSTDDPATTRYVVKVRNRGRVAATNFLVSITANDAPILSRLVKRLGPRRSTRVAVEAATCGSGDVVAEVDPDGRVDEISETNNTRSESCPGLQLTG